MGLDRSDSILFILVGIGLMVHHYLVVGLIFDVKDPVGHDWLGFGFIIIGLYHLYKGRGRR